MITTEPLIFLLLVAVAYLYFKVRQLERALNERPRERVRTARPADNRKVIPILKEEIEPGPFKVGNRWRQQPPPEDQS